jgi:hypothetical protein
MAEFKFWLIALLPFLFFLYNYMRKRKKNREKKESFYPVVALYFFSVVISAVFFALVIGDNIRYADIFNQLNALAAGR